VEYFFRVTIQHNSDSSWENYETVTRNKHEAIQDVLDYVEDCIVISVDCLGEAGGEDE
jgi:hypothetical protein